MGSKANTCQKDDSMVKDNRGTVGSVHRLQPVFKKTNCWKSFMTGWHLDKKVPLALLAAILAQAFVLGAWVSNVEARVSSVEITTAQFTEYQKQTIDTLARVDERIKSLGDILSKIEKKLP